MKVLHAYSGNLFGGVETLLLTLARTRVDGMESSFALCHEGRLSRELAAAGASPLMLSSRGPVRLSRPWTVWRARHELQATLRRERFDAVICHSPWTEAVLGPAVRASGTKLAFWLHDAISGKAWLERWAALTRPDLAICNSQFTAATLNRIYPGVPSEIVHCPVDKPPPPPEGKREQVRAALGIPNTAVVLIQASRMQAWKGHELHLKTLAELKDEPGWISLIAGGPQRDSEKAYFEGIQAQARELGLGDRVRFLGQRSDIAELLVASDIHFQPNEGPEPFGIAFVEALYSGIPVVTTAMGGALEIVSAECGILAPRGDTKALAAALRALISSPERRRALGSAGPERARAISDPIARGMQLREGIAHAIHG